MSQARREVHQRQRPVTARVNHPACCGAVRGASPEPAGFILLATMAFLAAVMTFSSIALTRATMELSAASRFAAAEQAFHLAEGALDAALADLAAQGSTADDIGSLIGAIRSLPELPGSPPPTYRYEEEGEGTDALLRVIATGQTENGTVTRTLRTAVELPGGTWEPQPFDYAITTGRLDLQANAQIGWDASDPAEGGDPSDMSGSGRVDLYIHDYYGNWGASPETQVIAANQGKLWARRVDIVDRFNRPLTDMCIACADTNVFPTYAEAFNEAPPLPPAPISPYFNCGHSSCTNINTPPQLDVVDIDLNYFYEQAIQQCASKPGNTEADCRNTGLSGTRLNDWYNHITGDTTITGGRTTPLVLDGIIYIEAQANVTFKNKVAIRGTIVHEGTGSSWGPGQIATTTTSELLIDSFAQTDVNGDAILENPVAPGMAVLGSAQLALGGQFGDLATNTPGIKGFVMGASGFQSYWNEFSRITADGIIEGGVIGVHPKANEWYRQNMGGTYDPYLRVGVNGPVTYAGIIEPVYKFWIWDGKIMVQNAQVRFKPLEEVIPGLPQTSGGSTPGGVTRPTVRYWAMQ